MGSRLDLDSIVHYTVFIALNPFLATLLPLALLASSTATLHSVEFRASAIYTAVVWTIHLLRRLDHGFRQRHTFNHAAAPRTPPSLRDSVVIVTGGSNGLGRCITVVLHGRSRGCVIINLDVAPPRDPVPGVTFMACDVSDTSSVARARDTILARFGNHIHVVVSCAGILCVGDILHTDMARVDDVFRVNVRAQFVLAQTFLPYMQAGAQWVTIASALGHIGVDSMAAYTASKAAVISFHESLTAELARQGHGVATTLVMPGQINTDMFAGLVTPNRFLAPVLDVLETAKTIVGKIEKREAGEFGVPFYVNYMGLMRVLPSGLTQLLRYLARADDAAVDLATARAGPHSAVA